MAQVAPFPWLSLSSASQKASQKASPAPPVDTNGHGFLALNDVIVWLKIYQKPWLFYWNMMKYGSCKCSVKLKRAVRYSITNQSLSLASPQPILPQLHLLVARYGIGNPMRSTESRVLRWKKVCKIYVSLKFQGISSQNKALSENRIPPKHPKPNNLSLLSLYHYCPY